MRPQHGIGRIARQLRTDVVGLPGDEGDPTRLGFYNLVSDDDAYIGLPAPVGALAVAHVAALPGRRGGGRGRAARVRRAYALPLSHREAERLAPAGIRRMGVGRGRGPRQPPVGELTGRERPKPMTAMAAEGTDGWGGFAGTCFWTDRKKGVRANGMVNVIP